MEHLTTESLARLIDETAPPDEAEHLRGCAVCAAELQAMHEQREALRALPEIMPPKNDWRGLEARLRSEGLIRDAGLFTDLGLARTPAWMKAAAAIVLFLAGAGTGAALATQGHAAQPGSSMTAAVTVEDAASAVRMAEQGYVSAVSRYRELLAQDGSDDFGGDPASRYAALEHLVLVSQAAVRQAPGDPFLNGFLASALAERDAAARLVSTSRDNWF